MPEKDKVEKDVDDIIEESTKQVEEKPIEDKGQAPASKTGAYIVGGVVVFIILLIFLMPVVVKSINTFNYKGFEFAREKFSEITVFRHSYVFFDSAGQQYQYNLYLRNDPRKNEVPIEGDLFFSLNRPVYISVNSTDFEGCGTALRDVAAVSSFLSDNQIDIKAAHPVKETAEEFNLTYASCDEHPVGEVVLISSGDKTEVRAGNDGCYEIRTASCDDLTWANEKFIVETIIQARSKSR